jgi:hypothetical protein
MQTIQGRPRSSQSAQATTTIQRKQQDEAEKFLRAIEGEVSKWIQKVLNLIKRLFASFVFLKSFRFPDRRR